MKYRIVFSVIVFIISTLQAQAQFKFSDKPDEFIVNLQDMMKALKSPQSIKNVEELSAAWSGGQLNDAQKKQIILLTQQMGQKRMKPRPNFEALVATLNAAVNVKRLDATKMNEFLEVTRKVTEKQNANKIQGYIESCKNFFEKDALYFSNVYALKAAIENNQFTFLYIETSDTSGLGAYIAPQVSKFKDFDNENAIADPAAPAPAVDPMLLDPNAPPQPVVAAPSSDVPLSGAIIHIDKVNLTFQTNYDSSTIEQTSVDYMLDYGLLVGKGGKFDWRMAGLDPNETYCTFKNYIFQARLPEFAAKDVKMYYKSKIDQAVDGIFEFKSRRYKSPQQAQFPRFKSYKADIELKNLGDDILYKGGFSLAGARVSSANVSGSPATLKVKKTDGSKVAFVSKSPRFEIGDSVITSKAASMRMNVGLDSIVHPSARLLYNRKGKKIEMYKEGGFYKTVPFFDSFHEIEISCEGAKWDLDSAKISFYVFSANNRNPALFESLDFYKDARFDDLQGGFSFNPLLMVIGYSRASQKETFYEGEVAAKYNQNLTALRGGLVGIASQGFIAYEPANGKVTIKDKAKHYYEAHRKKKDFDYMSIPSIAPRGANGVLDLHDNSITVSGVDKFFLSDSLGVYIVPNDRKVKILKDRDMVFDGRINAGSFLAYGHNFKFDYKEFKVDLAKIDSVLIQLDSKKGLSRKKNKSTGKLENRGIDEEKEGADVNAAAKATSGVLYINKPDNKSGLKRYAQYPIFDVVSNSYVYFDNPQVLNKAYNQKVRFKLPPFNADSVASTDPNSISFEGTFMPDKIFPHFKERLTIRADKSLGFTHKVPAEGYQLYEGSGKFFGVITLDNKGIRGKGEIQYLTSTIRSDDFIFYQDSVVTNGSTFVMKEGTIAKGNYPDAQVTAYHMKWIPAVDSMIVNNIKTNTFQASDYTKKYKKSEFQRFRMYEKTAKLDGMLVVASTGVSGAGLVETRGSEIVSPNYTFDIDRFSGRNAIFKIVTKDTAKPAVLCQDVKFLFNLKEKFAEFNPEVEGFASNAFPYTQYKTSIPKAVWYLDRNIVEMDKPEDVDISNSYFYSTKEGQDSLNFSATSAIYDITKFLLNIKGVPYIKVADAQIYPDKGEVTVEQDAKMEQLKKAVMIVDTLNKYHRLIDANLRVYSRHEFTGDALYQYVNSDNDTLSIRFNSFAFAEDEKASTKRKKVVFTTSGGDVAAETPLKITPGVLYKGHVAMDARKPNLDFDGEVRLDIKNNKNIVWLKYVNKESRDFALNLDGAKDETGRELQTGLFMQDGQLQLYTIFAAPKNTQGDKAIFSVAGNLLFKPETREFKVGSTDKINAKKYEGDVFTYNDSLLAAQFEGKYDLMSPAIVDRDFKLNTVGTTNARLDSNFYDFNLMMSAEFDMPAPAWKSMGKKLSQRAADLSAPEANEDKTALLYKLADIAGERAAQDFSKLAQTQYTAIPTVISKLAKGLLLSNVDMKWSQEHSAWYSVGKIGVSNVQRQDVNAKIDGYLEIKKTVTGTVFTLYLEASPDAWYFFSYDNALKRMMIASADEDFGNIIASKSKADKAKPDQYAFAPSDPIERVMFIKSFNKNYLGREVTMEMLQKEREKAEEKNAEDDPLAPADEKKDEPKKTDDASATPADSTQKATPVVPATDDGGGFGDDPAPAVEKKVETPKVVTPPPADTAQKAPANLVPVTPPPADAVTPAADTTQKTPVVPAIDTEKAKEEAKKKAEEEKKKQDEAKKEAERKRLEEEKKKAEEKKKEEEDSGGF